MSYTPVVNANTLQLYLGICATGKATASSTALTNVSFGTVYNPRPGITFQPSDQGMPIAICGGGPVDADMPPVYFVQGALFVTTIAAYVSPTEVTLAAAPDTSIYNTGFATVILYRPCPFASDVANVPMQFQFNSSIAPGTNDTMQFSTLNSLGGVDNPYVDRFGPILLGQPVYLKSTDSSVGDIFGGYIDTLQTASQAGVPGKPYSWSAQCVSWAGLARRRVVPPANPTTFTNVAGDQVFRQVVLDYLSDDSVAVSVTTAPDITLACPVGANIGQLLDQIVSLVSTEDTAWYWTTDAWRTFILTTRTATAAPWDVSDGSDLFAGDTPYQQSITATHNQMANFVYAIGTNTLLNTLNANLVGNGTATTFNLPEAVGAPPTITLNSNPQTVGLLGTTGSNWYWSQGSAVLTQDSGGAVLGPTDTLAVSYTPETPAVAQAPNVGSLQSLQAIEGTSANYEHSTTLSQPILPADLLAFATAYEIEYGMPATTVQFYTLRPGLKTGQLQTIALPDAGIPSGSYLIATLQMTTVSNVIVWQYTAFGGANIGDAITALTQFINRDQAELAIINPTTPITGATVPGATGNFASGLAGNASVPNLPFPSFVTQGNLLVVVAARNNMGLPVSVTDSQGNTYIEVVSAANPGFFPNKSAILYAFASTTGPCDVVCSGSWFITIGEFTGIDPTHTVDTSAGLSGAAPSVTVANANNLVVTGMGMDSTANIPTVTPPEALIGYSLGGGAAGDNAAAFEIVSAAGSFTSTLASAAGDPVYVTVSFNRLAPTAPPAQTTTVLGNPQGTVTHSLGLLTAGRPVIGHGGGDVTVGTKTSTNGSTLFATAEVLGTSTGFQPAIWSSSSNLEQGVAGQFVPSGGSTGQVLTKNSSTDYDDAWITPPAGAWTDDGTEVFLTNSPRKVGIGTSTPASEFQVVSVGVSPEILFDSYAAGVNLVVRRAGGTVASPTAVASGQALSTWGFAGWNGSAFATAVQLQAAAEETFSGTANGAQLRFFTTTPTTTTLSERMRILGDGDVLIGATSDDGSGALLQVHGSINIPTGSNFEINGTPITAGVSVTTKGDVQGYSTVPARIPVGTDNYVFTADSSAALGVSWKPASGGTLPTTGWSSVNGAVYNDFPTPGSLGFLVPDSGSLNWRFVSQSLSTGVPYVWIVTVRFFDPNNANSQTMGVYLSDGTKLIGFEMLNQSASVNNLRVERMNSVTSDDATVAGPTQNVTPYFLVSFKITNDGTHRTFFYYSAGSWVQFYQEATGAWLTETVIGVGGLSAVGSAGAVVAGEIVSWSLTT